MSTFDRINTYVRGSATLKLIGVAILGLILLIPASLVDNLIYERQNLRDQVVSEISSTWGAEQRLAGPLLEVPFTETYRTETSDGDARLRTRRGSAYFLPEDVKFEGATVSEERYRGIYVAVLYTATVEVSGRFDSLALARLDIDASALDWSRAALTFGVSDLRGIDSLTDVRFGRSSVAFEPGVPGAGLLPTGFQAPVKVGPDFAGGEFSFGFSVRGSSALAFVPLSARTQVSLTSDYGTPKFAGAFLPDSREVSDAGFSASWEVLEVNRPFASEGTLRGNGQGLPIETPDFAEAGVDRYRNPSVSRAMTYDDYGNPTPSTAGFGGYEFGVRFLLPVDEYRKIDRSAKYSALFLAATFLTFFFIEVLNGRRLHPVQYLLVGAAVVLFYVLLLSLSEHLGFDAAYGVSVVLILGLITAYASAVLRKRKLTFLVAGILAILYGFFYSLLQLEDYSLLLGSLGLLLALAVVMYVTRKTDWYGQPSNPA